MRRFALSCTLAVLVAFVGAALADDLEPIPSEILPEVAKRLTEAADKLAGAPISVGKVDSDKSAGLFNESVGGIVVTPQKDLKMENTKGVEDPTGAPVGYLFLYQLTPAVDGKSVDGGKVESVSLKDDNSGEERKINVLRLSVKKVSDEDWKLYVFAKDKKPIVVSTFRAEDKKSEVPIHLEAKDVKDGKLTLVVNLYGKYSANVNLTSAK